MKSILFLAALVLRLYSPLECGQKFVRIYLPNDVSIKAELAVSLEERALGLMFREKINNDQGMLFVFEEEDIHSFWMKNTLIPLDILWLDKDQRIVHIEENVPPCRADPCPSYTPCMPALYVLELKEGSVADHGLKLYDRLGFVLQKS